jgi:putative FmdB family regulatory protein
MPIYEYRCGACGHTLDALQKLSDAPLKDCPECGVEALKRLVSAPAFRLKGGGWYETDFKSDKEKRRNLADEPKTASKDGEKSEKSEKAKADKTTESKPADAAKSKAEPKSSGAKSTGTEAA